ncbi:hypothetical protein LOCC1_G002784 [Lachnellula occidentalis]|uniref:Uncharacterized protein n=1 Tax=Lachnellula occidentalis TaxID=215460 RepID=A0A8H8S4T0_9HELO|nr:hypothetical protein LOCC1_G002784 [Lachnellula occidentalis]
MSFLTRTTPMLRVAARASCAPRAFSTSLALKKSPVEAVKDTAKTVDRKISDTLVDGIEIGQTAAEKAKAAAGLASDKASGKTAEMAGEAKGMAGQAQGKAQGMAGQAKGKAAELKGEAMGKAEETKKGGM